MYTRIGDSFVRIDKTARITDTIEPGIYKFSQASMKMDHCIQKEKDFFPMPEKIYGKTTDLTNRIINTYRHRRTLNVNTGVLAHGIQGSGKSLLCNQICNSVVQSGGFVVRVTTHEYISELMNIVEFSETEKVIYFDEFEKVFYEEQYQHILLPYMSGGHHTKTLFLMTTNNIQSLAKQFFKRPERIFYNIKFDNIDTDIVRFYCQDKLNQKEWVEDTVMLAELIPDITIDVIFGIIEESNRYNSHPFKVTLDMGLIDTSVQYMLLVYEGNRDITYKIDMNSHSLYFERSFSWFQGDRYTFHFLSPENQQNSIPDSPPENPSIRNSNSHTKPEITVQINPHNLIKKNDEGDYFYETSVENVFAVLKATNSHNSNKFMRKLTELNLI